MAGKIKKLDDIGALFVGQLAALTDAAPIRDVYYHGLDARIPPGDIDGDVDARLDIPRGDLGVEAMVADVTN